ncbi:hypothetical protein [Candidatus Hydrogenosomobacter endosymbioticus]|uniref:Uncharacterized protein n=1 Tax=Candidatus Hydrogenosomobacter endosymbioticus TaxID=2558174 RepID=A0ABM7V8M6_9PROT|nr:hypothetical protein [Candidatus Hydrogenosomobacter endosymbioticus]BDB96122.1 hypothetical protein HYD_2550 [Candidatus Hydrogenosomobacter endosymbioticus]
MMIGAKSGNNESFSNASAAERLDGLEPGVLSCRIISFNSDVSIDSVKSVTFKSLSEGVTCIMFGHFPYMTTVEAGDILFTTAEKKHTTITSGDGVCFTDGKKVIIVY